jgi:hypothetical protein
MELGPAETSDLAWIHFQRKSPHHQPPPLHCSMSLRSAAFRSFTVARLRLRNPLLQRASSPFAKMSTTATTTEISASRILRLFPNDVNPTVIGSGQANGNNTDLEGYDEEQVRLMDEVCIVIDADDKPIGSGSKKICLCPSINSLSLRN